MGYFVNDIFVLKDLGSILKTNIHGRQAGSGCREESRCPCFKSSLSMQLMMSKGRAKFELPKGLEVLLLDWLPTKTGELSLPN